MAEVRQFGDGVTLRSDGLVSLEVPVFDEQSGSVEVGDSYEMDAEEAQRVGSALLHAARAARRNRGEST